MVIQITLSSANLEQQRTPNIRIYVAGGETSITNHPMAYNNSGQKSNENVYNWKLSLWVEQKYVTM